MPEIISAHYTRNNQNINMWYGGGIAAAAAVSNGGSGNGMIVRENIEESEISCYEAGIIKKIYKYK